MNSPSPGGEGKLHSAGQGLCGLGGLTRDGTACEQTSDVYRARLFYFNHALQREYMFIHA